MATAPPANSAAYLAWLLTLPGTPYVWPLDDAVGSGTAREAGGHTAGAVTGALTFGATGPTLARTATTAGTTTTNGLVNTGVNTPSGAMAVACWIKATAYNAFLWLNHAGASVYPHYTLQQSTGRLIHYFALGNCALFSVPSIFDGAWHSLVCTVPGSGQTDIQRAKTYLDGVSIAQLSATATTAQDPRGVFTIGNDTGGEGLVNGTFSTAAIAGAEWTAQEAWQFHNFGKYGNQFFLPLTGGGQFAVIGAGS